MFQPEYEQVQKKSSGSGPRYANPTGSSSRSGSSGSKNGVVERSKEQKYAEDILALHEAYQVVPLRHRRALSQKQVVLQS